MTCLHWVMNRVRENRPGPQVSIPKQTLELEMSAMGLLSGQQGGVGERVCDADRRIE